jgi:hypothetical protein
MALQFRAVDISLLETNSSKRDEEIIVYPTGKKSIMTR